MSIIQKMWLFMLNLLSQSLSQILSIFGVFFLFGLLLYLLARFTRRSFIKSIGLNSDIYFTGCIGVPIHELGHALFCVFFGHKITEICLFKPDANDQTIGFVNHQYNRNNIYHQIGNFFIGIGPIILGSFIIFLLIKYLVPNGEEIFATLPKKQDYLSNLSMVPQQLKLLFESGKAAVSLLFIKDNFSHWTFYIFMYLSLSIASHMELSPADLKGTASGLITIFMFFLIINTICLLLDINITAVIIKTSSLTAVFTKILALSTILSAIYYFSTYIVLSIILLITKQKLFIPIG